MSHKVLLMINKIIVESKTRKFFPNLVTNIIRNKYPLQKILIRIAKAMLMNEIELVYFSIYLDKMGWEPSNYSFEDNLLLTALTVKVKKSFKKDLLKRGLSIHFRIS